MRLPSSAWARGPAIPRMLVLVQLVILLLVVRSWAYVTTYRLYLDGRVNTADQSSASQQFDIEGARVVPQIVTRGPDRVAFTTAVGQDSTIHVDVRPTRRATYAIEWRDGPSHRVLAQGTVDRPASIVSAYPTGTGVIELVSDGPLAWVDPRVVRDLRIHRHVAALGMLGACWLAWTWWARRRAAPARIQPMRLVWFRVAAVIVSTTVTLLISEVVLRALGDTAPVGVVSERHDLGEVTRDPRWEESTRYGRRLRAHVNALNEWRYGDIVRMGYIPPAVSDATLHQFRFQTDAEGFRNKAVRERFEIAALGDSFTDAMTMAAEAAWPMRLERTLGVAVQNYGTAGFGPTQELLVLKDFVAPHRPRLVVLAFFAGNDIFDAEGFDEFQRAGGIHPPTPPGWRIKEVVSRADTWHVVSVLRAGARWLSAHQETAVSAAAIEPPPLAPASDVSPPAFDRGMFAVTVGGRRLRWAFMPPYLNTLRFSEGELAARRGWALTRDAIREMQTVSRSFGAELVVMFIPFKSQVYLPLAADAFTPDALRAALRFYLDGSERAPVDPDRMLRNRLAQNHLVRRLCEEAGIPFLDTTGALEGRLKAGENVYFPDESHLNESGESVVADALAAFLRARRIP